MRSTKLVQALAAGILALSAWAGTATAAPIVSTSDPALAGATVETFNSVTQGSYASFTVNDVTVQSASVLVTTGSNGQYAPPNPSGDVFLLSSNSTISFSFNTAVSAFGIVVGATNYEQTLSAFDAGDNLIESLTIPNQVSTIPFPYSGFYGIASSAADIAYFTITQFSDGIVYDDLYYTSATAVPEPGPLAVLVLGLAALGCARRRHSA